METAHEAGHLFEVERSAYHADRPGFRIAELQIGPSQQVPWHYHTNVQDTFVVLQGSLRLFLRNPKEEVRLAPGETYTRAGAASPSGHELRRRLGGLPGPSARRLRLRPAHMKRHAVRLALLRRGHDAARPHRSPSAAQIRQRRPPGSRVIHEA